MILIPFLRRGRVMIEKLLGPALDAVRPLVERVLCAFESIADSAERLAETEARRFAFLVAATNVVCPAMCGARLSDGTPTQVYFPASLGACPKCGAVNPIEAIRKGWAP